MKRKPAVAAVAATLLLASYPLRAHHGQAAYDMTKPVTVNGTVTEFKFANPHCIVLLEVKDAGGVTQQWQGELTSPNRLVRAGWTSRSIKATDHVTLTGWRAKSGAPSLYITKTFVNGQELKLAAGP